MKINGSVRAESDKKRRLCFKLDEYKVRCHQVKSRLATNLDKKLNNAQVTNVDTAHATKNTIYFRPQLAKYCRVRNRCIFTGRSRGITRYFKASRIQILELFSKGYLPGVRKSSD